MPRFLSAVMTLSSSLPIVLTQTCRTFFLSGAIQARCLPSGESRGETRSGLPKSVSRGMSGGSCAKVAAAGPRVSAASASARAAVRKRLCMREISFPFGDYTARSRPGCYNRRPHGDEARNRREVDCLEQEGVPRLLHPRQARVGHRPDRHRGQVAAGWPGESEGQLRRSEGRPGVPRRDAHLALYTRQPRELRAGADAQAAAAPPRNREAERADHGEGTDGRPAAPLFQRWQGEGGDRGRARQETVRQTRDREAAESRSGNGGGEEAGEVVWYPSHTCGVSGPHFPLSCGLCEFR